MNRRTALRVALVVLPLGVVIGLPLLAEFMSRFFLTIGDQPNEEGPWELQFPAEDHASVLSEAHPLEGGFSRHGFGRWFAQGPSVFRGGQDECLALGPDLEVMGQLALRYRCHDIVDLGENAPILVALIAESPAPFGKVAVGLSSQGDERWRFTPSDSIALEVAAPLYDDGGLYGVAFGPGGDEGVVAVDLDGRRIWQISKEYVIYALSSHPLLPASLLVLGGDWSLFEHSREGVQVPGSLERRASRHSETIGEYIFTHDGVAFPEADGSTSVIVVGVTFSEVPHVSRCDEQGREVWRARLSGEAQGVALLGRRRGKLVFAAVLRNKAIVVFDEDGTLLDQARVPDNDGGRGFYVFGFDGGEIEAGRGVITLDTSLGNYLFDVDLGE